MTCTEQTPRRKTAFVVIATALLLLPACSSSWNDTDAGDDAQATPAVQDATLPPLRVGLIANVTGPLPSGEENAVAVIDAWVDVVNASGGVGGRQVEIMVADTKGDAPTATAEVQRLTTDETVIAAILFDAATEGLVAEAITEAGIPVIGGMGYAPNAWGAMPNWLPLTTSIPSIFNMGMVLGGSLGGERAALTICAEISACEAAAPIAEAASDQQGMSFAGTYKIDASAPSYTAECLELIEDGADYVMLGAATTAAALRVAEECTLQGYDGHWGLFGGVIFPHVMKEHDPGIQLSLALNSFPWFADAPPVQAYRDMMVDAGLDEDTWGDLHGTAAYATMELFRFAIEANADRLPGTPARSDIIEAYGSVQGETLDGLLPQPITFNPGEPNALVTCYWFGTFEDGHFTDSDLSVPVCDPPELAATTAP